MSSIRLTLAQARRLAVSSQLLPAPPGTGILDLARHLGYLQLDPTNSIARSHELVLWSRLGAYDRDELEQLRWQDRQLYEYDAALVPIDHYPIHADTMARYPSWSAVWTERVKVWLERNAALRRQVLSQLRKHGPIASRELKGLTHVRWESTGWTNDRNVTQMLQFLHRQGKVVIAGRQGQQRLWDLAERWLPSDSRLPRREAERQVADRSARALGVATAKEIAREYFPGGPYPG
ncbi:MAG TPA: crosslink repair DNA glycosylase YcaQ family protein, partial [Gaiellaceae bacterium]|nr:crosslink repair DNA glycosylase YcaQ family protein [Gaiellaceae bacterium]